MICILLPTQGVTRGPAPIFLRVISWVHLHAQQCGVIRSAVTAATVSASKAGRLRQDWLITTCLVVGLQFALVRYNVKGKGAEMGYILLCIVFFKLCVCSLIYKKRGPRTLCFCALTPSLGNPHLLTIREAGTLLSNNMDFKCKV